MLAVIAAAAMKFVYVEKLPLMVDTSEQGCCNAIRKATTVPVGEAPPTAVSIGALSSVYALWPIGRRSTMPKPICRFFAQNEMTV
ncbi:hypothetical protein [Neomesorhizobium albiziae]|uniref:hypothetical protein n=1 Tax=Neomesorhizobium albiziae TaxID=335020 RepID=UPI00165F57FA|nr:hypothetical protein [Mesorhizobium albiziae]